MFSSSLIFDNIAQALVFGIFLAPHTISLLASELTQVNPHFDLSVPAEASAFATMCPYSFEFAVTYASSLDLIDASSGMTLDPLVPELVLENDDYAFAGTTDIFKLHVKYNDAAFSFGDYSATSHLYFTINWSDQCNPPLSMTGNSQTDPDDYVYTGSSPSA